MSSTIVLESNAFLRVALVAEYNIFSLTYNTTTWPQYPSQHLHLHVMLTNSLHYKLYNVLHCAMKFLPHFYLTDIDYNHKEHVHTCVHTWEKSGV